MKVKIKANIMYYNSADYQEEWENTRTFSVKKDKNFFKNILEKGKQLLEIAMDEALEYEDEMYDEDYDICGYGGGISIGCKWLDVSIKNEEYHIDFNRRWDNRCNIYRVIDGRFNLVCVI